MPIQHNSPMNRSFFANFYQNRYNSEVQVRVLFNPNSTKGFVMCKKMTILMLISMSAPIAAQCPTMTECAAQKAACMVVADSMKSCPEMTEEEMIRCGCNKPKPRSQEAEQGCMTEEEAMRCGCNKPKPRSGEAVECCMTEEEMIRCGCNKPKPRTEEVEATETTTTCGKCSNPKHR